MNGKYYAEINSINPRTVLDKEIADYLNDEIEEAYNYGRKISKSNVNNQIVIEAGMYAYDALAKLPKAHVKETPEKLALYYETMPVILNIKLPSDKLFFTII